MPGAGVFPLPTPKVTLGKTPVESDGDWRTSRTFNPAFIVWVPRTRLTTSVMVAAPLLVTLGNAVFNGSVQVFESSMGPAIRDGYTKLTGALCQPTRTWLSNREVKVKSSPAAKPLRSAMRSVPGCPGNDASVVVFVGLANSACWMLRRKKR